MTSGIFHFLIPAPCFQPASRSLSGWIPRLIGLIALFSCFPFFLYAQVNDPYVLNGEASQNDCNCYTLTRNENFVSGSVWNKNKISLNQPFNYYFNIYLGCDAHGADGIVFILQPVSTSLGAVGGGLGFQGIRPSVGVTIDTYQNLSDNDPAYDHIAIQTNGVIRHD
ncbi:MAG TPA: L-type lectin-domain containing protein, partial [Chitinophagaceae bacterium]